MKGTLYVCATPIGHLDDITLRAIQVLRDVQLIAAEDTRRTRQLCAHFAIDTPLVSCFEQNEPQRATEIVARLHRGESVAYVSDAGTPGIADPGARLVRAVREAGHNVVPVPGVSAVTAALSVAGFAADAFRVVGFLPRSGKRRRAALEHIALESDPVVLFESPRRIRATLDDLADSLGERPLWVGRELTKAYESSYWGTAAEVSRELPAAELRGEFTLVIGPEAGVAPDADTVPAATELPLAEEVALLAAAGLAEREAIRRVAQAHGLPRQAVYRLVKTKEK